MIEQSKALAIATALHDALANYGQMEALSEFLVVGDESLPPPVAELLAEIGVELGQLIDEETK